MGDSVITSVLKFNGRAQRPPDSSCLRDDTFNLLSLPRGGIYLTFILFLSISHLKRLPSTEMGTHLTENFEAGV